MKRNNFRLSAIIALSVMSLFLIGTNCYAEGYTQSFSVSATIPLVIGLNDPETLAKNAANAGKDEMISQNESQQAEDKTAQIQEEPLIQLAQGDNNTLYAR